MPRALVFLASLCLAAASFAAGTLSDGIKAYDAGDHALAYSILRPLADAGDAIAQLRVGLLLYSGSGVGEDEAQAVAWLRKSAAQGNLDAMYQLGVAFTFGNQTAKMVADSDVEAVKWYFEAAHRGHRDAQYSLGLMFLAGKGVVPSRDEAFAWISKAAAQGHREAQSFVQGQGGPHR